MADMVKRFNTPDCESGMHEFEPRYPPQSEINWIDTKNISPFLFYRVISLILGINRLIFGEVAFFSLPVLKGGNLSKAQTSNKKHELTIKNTNIL